MTGTMIVETTQRLTGDNMTYRKMESAMIDRFLEYGGYDTMTVRFIHDDGTVSKIVEITRDESVVTIRR